jgi:hypothetical protein
MRVLFEYVTKSPNTFAREDRFPCIGALRSGCLPARVFGLRFATDQYTGRGKGLRLKTY